VLVQEIEIKNFRCFDHIKLTFDASVIFIEGANGVGKTSILEALHYLCYLRSFRTSTTKDMIQDNAAGFFIKVCLREHDQYSDHELTVGFSPKKRIIKFDNQVIGSFKELIPLVNNSFPSLILLKETIKNLLIKYIILFSSFFLARKSIRFFKLG